MKILPFVFLLFLLTSCSSLDFDRIAPNYVEAYRNIKGYALGFEDYPISRELVDKIPYASMKLSIGKGSAGLLILEESNDETLTYLSADGIRFVISKGVIIRTSGFDNNLTFRLEPVNSINNFLDSGKREIEYLIYHSYDEPKLINLKLKTSLKRMQLETHEILGEKFQLLRVEQTLENEYLGWKKTNTYWLDPKDYFVWKSKQNISPLLPEIQYEITKKPAK